MLVLEDDPTFSAIVGDCLSENGYTVVAVKNGKEGIREVLAGSFTVVLCDLMMPGLPGDMFYRAVARIRPDLCERFIFMTGDGSDSGTSEFFKKNNAFVLRKPFPLKSLLDAIALAEVRFTFRRLFETQPVDPAPSATPGPAGDIPAGGTPHSEESALSEKIARILARAQAGPVPGGLPRPSPAIEPELPASGTPRSFVLAVLVICLVLVAVLWNRHSVAAVRATSAAAERLALEAERNTVSPQLDEALAVRSKLEVARSVSALIAAERAKPRWTPALRCLIPAGNTGVQILEVQVQGQAKDSGACEIRIRGVADGTQPRLAADQYRRTVEESLRANANGRPVSTRLNQLYEVPGTVPGRQRAVLEMVATLGATGTNKEGSGR